MIKSNPTVMVIMRKSRLCISRLSDIFLLEKYMIAHTIAMNRFKSMRRKICITKPSFSASSPVKGISADHYTQPLRYSFCFKMIGKNQLTNQLMRFLPDCFDRYKALSAAQIKSIRFDPFSGNSDIPKDNVILRMLIPSNSSLD